MPHAALWALESTWTAVQAASTAQAIGRPRTSKRRVAIMTARGKACRSETRVECLKCRSTRRRPFASSQMAGRLGFPPATCTGGPKVCLHLEGQHDSRASTGRKWSSN